MSSRFPSLLITFAAVAAMCATSACASRAHTDAGSDTAASQRATTSAAVPAAQPSPADVAAQPSAAADGAAEFPAGTVLGEVGLPVYPTLKQNTRVNPTETDGDGRKSESMQLDPRAQLDTVVAWYKERMPAGSAVESLSPNHASFQIGKEGDHVIRMVVLDQVPGHVQTDIILMRKTVQ
jgi:hypothetical protein